MAEEPKDVHIQHQEPPVFYCWKYWFSTGEIKEGCNTANPTGDNLLDLNLYGWVYMLVPVLLLFLLVLVMHCMCGRGKKPVAKRQALVESEESDSDGEMMPAAFAPPPTRRMQSHAAGGRPNSRSFYSVVPADQYELKAPLHGGVQTAGFNNQRIYPRLASAPRMKSVVRQHTQERRKAAAEVPLEYVDETQQRKKEPAAENRAPRASSSRDSTDDSDNN